LNQFLDNREDLFGSIDIGGGFFLQGLHRFHTSRVHLGDPVGFSDDIIGACVNGINLIGQLLNGQYAVLRFLGLTGGAFRDIIGGM
jgi:hypothetical protein